MLESDVMSTGGIPNTTALEGRGAAQKMMQLREAKSTQKSLYIYTGKKQQPAVERVSSLQIMILLKYIVY